MLCESDKMDHFLKQFFFFQGYMGTQISFPSSKMSNQENVFLKE